MGTFKSKKKDWRDDSAPARDLWAHAMIHVP
jgi:hypothetical protein